MNVIIEVGFKAPVASNRYDSLHITVVQSPETLAQIIAATSDLVSQILKVEKGMDFGAKTLIMISSAPAMIPGIEYANAACVLENMLLAATAQGVDRIIWGGAAAAVKQHAQFKKALKIPDGFEPLLAPQWRPRT